jgi:hypothetical protein
MPTTTPGGNPVMDVPGYNPISPVSTESPVLVIVVAARMLKWAAVPRVITASTSTVRAISPKTNRDEQRIGGV